MPKEFECGAKDCYFMVRANDEEEIIEIVKKHAKEKHGKDADEDRVSSRIKDI